MGTFRDWVRRRRVLAAFAAGVLLTLAAVAIVVYLILADQRRSARILAAALTQALARGVEIGRVTDLGPSRVVLRGLRLPAERGWPAEVTAESVEASGPLLSAARGEAAPVRLLVTRPKIVAGGGGATGAAALEGLRQGSGEPHRERPARRRRDHRGCDPGAGLGFRGRDLRRDPPQGERRGARGGAAAGPRAVSAHPRALRAGGGRHGPSGPGRRGRPRSPGAMASRRARGRRPDDAGGRSRPARASLRATAPRGA